MANYVASARSNYFQVKDEDAFLAWAKSLPDLTVIGETDKDDGVKRFTILADGGDGAGWPTYRFPIPATAPFTVPVAADLFAWAEGIPGLTAVPEPGGTGRFMLTGEGSGDDPSQTLPSDLEPNDELQELVRRAVSENLTDGQTVDELKPFIHDEEQEIDL